MVVSEKVNVGAARWLRKKSRSRTDDGVIWLEKSNPSLRAGQGPCSELKDLESVLQNDIIQKEYKTGIVGKAAVYNPGLDLPSILPNCENPLASPPS